MTSTAITVQWGEVDCVHRNGDITGYTVQYGEVESESIQTVHVASDVTQTTISNQRTLSHTSSSSEQCRRGRIQQVH